MNFDPETTMTVLVEDDVRVRGVGDRPSWRRIPIQTEELAVNVNLFLNNIESVLEKTPDKIGKFRLDEISVSAEITGEGKVVLCGIGGEIGVTGGVQFVFKRGVE